MLKRILEFIRSIDLTAIGKKFLAQWGYFAQLIGGWFLSAAEKVVDKKIEDAEDAIDVKEKDKAIEADREKKAEAIINAKTDEDFDEAVRDSLR